MLAIFIIALREGLEAALIVGIIAAFLTRNRQSLRPMWIGVVAAVVISIGVGVGLKLVELALPQAAQEGMETVIGLIAVAFVLTMIVWMSGHGRGLKAGVEADVQEAMSQGAGRALALVAFLAVLKEGFESAVFMLATLSAATGAAGAATGAVLGYLASVGLGYGIYRGGVKLNLGKFFRWSSVFLVLVAGGLLVSALGTAHEAGWLNGGQQQVADLSWLVAPGSVQGALLTGVLGIPARPVLVQVVAWVAFVVPVGLFAWWPRDRRPGPRAAASLRWGLAALLTLGAGALALAVQTPAIARADEAPLASGGQVRLEGTTLVTPTGQVTLSDAGTEPHAGVTAQHWTAQTSPAASLPDQLSVNQLLSLAGGRLPVGVDPAVATGPFQAAWDTVNSIDVWTAKGALLDARATRRVVVTVSGGGLAGPRTVTVDDPSSVIPSASSADDGWRVADAHVSRVAQQAGTLAQRTADFVLWGRLVPLILIIAALALAGTQLRNRGTQRPTTPTTTTARSAAHV